MSDDDAKKEESTINEIFLGEELPVPRREANRRRDFIPFMFGQPLALEDSFQAPALPVPALPVPALHAPPLIPQTEQDRPEFLPPDPPDPTGQDALDGVEELNILADTFFHHITGGKKLVNKEVDHVLGGKWINWGTTWRHLESIRRFYRWYEVTHSQTPRVPLEQTFSLAAGGPYQIFEKDFALSTDQGFPQVCRLFLVT